MKNWLIVFSAALTALVAVYAFDRWTKSYEARTDELAARLQQMAQLGEQMLIHDTDAAEIARYIAQREQSLKGAERALHEGPPFARRDTLQHAVQETRRLLLDLKAKAK